MKNGNYRRDSKSGNFEIPDEDKKYDEAIPDEINSNDRLFSDLNNISIVIQNQPDLIKRINESRMKNLENEDNSNNIIQTGSLEVNQEGLVNSKFNESNFY